MKKYMGNYTNEAAKALKGSERIICRVADDGAIYVTNGFIAYKMNPPEYAAIVQPVTCCEAGNYTMQNGEKAADNSFDLVKLFNETVEQTANAPALERCPLTLQAGKAPAASYYNPAAGVASFYNAKFIAALTPSATLRATGAISAAVAYVGGEPLALVLPIKPEPKATQAVKAYFAEGDNDATAEADKLRADVERLRAKLDSAEAKAAALAERVAQQADELEALRNAPQAAPAAEQPEPKTAAELIAARFADLAGVTTTIKGAQTAAPVVWLAGDTERHADAIKAAGAKWSNKKSAYYVRVA